MARRFQPEATLLYLTENSHAEWLLSVKDGPFESIVKPGQQHTLLNYITFASVQAPRRFLQAIAERVNDPRLDILEQARVRMIALFEEGVEILHQCRRVMDYVLVHDENEVICLGSGSVEADPFIFGQHRFLSPNSTLQVVNPFGHITLGVDRGFLKFEEDPLRHEEQTERVARMLEKVYEYLENNSSDSDDFALRSMGGSVLLSEEVIRRNDMAVFGNLEVLLRAQIGVKALGQLPKSFRDAIRRTYLSS